MNKPKFEVAVGFFVVVGFLLVSVMVFIVSGIYFFRPGYHLSAHFDYVGIINRGAPVRFSGVHVGEVSNVKILHSDGGAEQTKVEVKFFIEKGVQIKEHDKVSVQGTHIMSEPHIEITPQPGEGRILKDGDVIPNGISPATIDDLILRGDSISKRLDVLLGNVSVLFEDPETRKMMKDSLKNMNQVLASMSEITSGQEKEFRDAIGNLGQATNQMAELLKRINQGEGTIGKLVAEDEIYNDLRDFTKDIKSHPWKLLKKG
jgi:phospholipid/cholesterol/gamma-HCH transport system substrate-binding protein